MANKDFSNPWKGLNFYIEGEVIYGRNAEIQSLSQYIFNNAQTVLYGRSGIGKSSILNAGIFPRARMRGMIPVSIRLKHDDTNNYVLQIREAIEKSGLTPEPLLPAVRGEENESLWEFLHRHNFLDSNGEQRIPLLVFDQFEEIFTLQRNEKLKREFFRELGNLLNDVKPTYIVEHENKARKSRTTEGETKVVSSGAFKGLSLKLNIRRNDSEEEPQVSYIEHPDYHIVFAMREDFLSSLELYASSIPVMKDNRFGLLPINEEQAADIISLPREGLVDKEVAKLIIQQVTGRSDFELDGNPEIEVDAAVLSLYLSRLYIKKPENEPCITKQLVRTYSGHIINDFYLDAICSKPEENELISKESIFLLENQLLTREGRRNNVSRSDLKDQGISENELDILIDKRKLLRQFNHGNDMRIEYIHDILCPVVKERKEQRELLEQQERERLRQEQEKKLLLERQRKERRRTRILLGSAALLILGIVGWLALDWFLNDKEYKTYYADFTRRNGWPVGVGKELSHSEASKLSTFYCLVRYGNNSKHNVEVLISPGRDMAPHDMRIPLVGADDQSNKEAIAFSELMGQTRKIIFSSGPDDNVAKEVAYDKDGHVLYSTNYYGENQMLWAVYTDANGSPIKLSNNADRMRVMLDPQSGLESKCMFYDSQGVPCHNYLGDYGYNIVYDEDNRIERLDHLNAFGNVNYSESRSYEDGNITIDYANAPQKYDQLKIIKNEKGEIAERRYYKNGRLLDDIMQPAIERMLYYDNGLLKQTACSDAYEKPFKGMGTKTALSHFTYQDGSRKLISESRLNEKGDTLYDYRLTIGAAVRDSIVDDRAQNTYLHKHSVYNDGVLAETSYYDREGNPAYNMEEDFHRLVVETKKQSDGGKHVLYTYYDEDGKLYDKGITRSESHFDKDGDRTFYRTFDADGNIISSMAYEYQNGIESARYAVGIHGTPIRCPQWESEHLCYYKLESVRDFSGRLAQVNALGEKGQPSLLYADMNGRTFSADTIGNRKIGCGWNFYTLRHIDPYTPKASDRKVNYIHLLKPGGAADKAGLLDGDILVSGTISPGCEITVKRSNPESDKAETKRFILPNTPDPGAEVYPVYYSAKEYDDLWK